MTRTAAELAEFLGARIAGAGATDASVPITGVAGIETAGPGQLTFLANRKYAHFLKTTGATAAIIPADDGLRGIARDGLILLLHAVPYQAFLRALVLFNPPPPDPEPGVDRAARIGTRVTLEDAVSVGPNCVVEDEAILGAGTVILAGSFVGRESVLGKNCRIGPNTTVMHGCTLGDRVRIHSGTVIGADGFGFAPIDGKYEKIPQVGGVTIGDDVEIGACCTIDRATMEQTVVGRGTKIDNLVMIAHNVQVGEDCVIVSQTGVAGSTRVGNKVTLAAQTGIIGHIEIGAGAIIMARAGISKSVPPGAVYLGSPAREAGREKRIIAVENSLPDHVKTIRQLEKRLAALEETLRQHSASE